MTDDATLMRRVREAWEQVDPPPAHLAERVLFALELEDLDTEFELLRLTQRADALAGTRAGRGSSSDATHITFSGEQLTVMLAVAGLDRSGRRLDGWIAPAAQARVVAHTAEGERQTEADATGRFVLTDVPAGMLRLVFFPATDDESATPFITPTVEV